MHKKENMDITETKTVNYEEMAARTKEHEAVHAAR